MKHNLKIAVQGSLVLVSMVLTLIVTNTSSTRGIVVTPSNFKTCIADVMRNREVARIAIYQEYFDSIIAGKNVYKDALYAALLMEDKSAKSSAIETAKNIEKQSIAATRSAAMSSMQDIATSAKQEIANCKSQYGSNNAQNASAATDSSDAAQSSDAQSSQSSSTAQSSEQASSQVSSQQLSKVYPWTRTTADDAQESAFHTQGDPTVWGLKCTDGTNINCIRYVSAKHQGTNAVIRVRIEGIKRFNINANDLDFVSATLWKSNGPDGGWTKSTTIKHDQFWGNSPYPVYARSINVGPGTHVYKVVLAQGRVNSFGIPQSSEVIDEVVFSVNVPAPDPAVKLEDITSRHTGQGTGSEQIHYTGRITGYKQGVHAGFINWGRGLERFTVNQDGTFDFIVGKGRYNPGGERFLAYCPTWFVVASPYGATNILARTVYDKMNMCPKE